MPRMRRPWGKMGPMHEDLLLDDPAAAARLLAAGGLVGLPTETVYGLAADAGDPHAVARVYAVKGRPADHPLIVHLALGHPLDGWVRDVPGYARALAAEGWPGPLTLVLPRGPRAGHHVTGGQETVAVRVPDHPVAQAVLAAGGLGLAAPSANRFGRVSPTSSADVVEELGHELVPGRDGVLEGGPSGVGLESTIVDCTAQRPRILRPGAVTAADVSRWTGLEVDDVPVATAQGPAAAPRTPGQLAAHYAPAARVVLVDSRSRSVPDRVQALLGQHGHTTGRTGFLATADWPTPEGLVRLATPGTVRDFARDLYAALRRADALGLALAVVVVPEGQGLAAAIRDRLARAAVGSARQG